jgi:hypothetical protein
LALKPRKHTTTSRLDIKSFEYSEASDHNWDKKIAEELKKDFGCSKTCPINS